MRLDTLPNETLTLPQRAGAWPRVRVGAGAAVPLALYGLALALLLVGIGSHPPFVYNWEEYTAWRFFPFWDHPTGDLFARTEGLMTDSGKSPFVALPLWLGWTFGGVGLESLRPALAVETALAAPLLWAVGRRLAGSGAAALGAVLLALSPVFLLYGRTGTVVGLSLAPALATVYALVRVLQEPRSRRWLFALQALLVIGQYAYAPIRFLWPISLALLASELVLRGKDRLRLLPAVLLTATVLPAALTLTSGREQWQPVAEVNAYYEGRGEQVRAMRNTPDYFRGYLRPTREELLQGRFNGTPDELAWRLVRQNAEDYANLLLDRNTMPALLAHWLPEGRLYAGLLVPFFLIGLAGAAWRAWRRMEDRALLALFFGCGLPLILTTRVHIGRLIFALPFLLLIVAGGYLAVARWVPQAAAWLAHRRARTHGRAGRAAWSEPSPAATTRQTVLARVVVSGLILALPALVAGATWEDYRTLPGPDKETRILAFLRDQAPQVAGPAGTMAIVLGGAPEYEAETIHVAAYRLALDRQYRFVDLSAPPEAPQPAADGRLLIYYGGLLALLEQPGRVPTVCENTYYVGPAFEKRFLAVSASYTAPCGHPLRYQRLPD